MNTAKQPLIYQEIWEAVKASGLSEKIKTSGKTPYGIPNTELGYASEETGMNGNNRSDIKVGAHVMVVQKQDQRSGRLTEGIVMDILTKSGIHPHGIKVRLQNGVVGRVKEILEDRR